MVMYQPEMREFSEGKELIVCHLATREDVVELFINEKHHLKFKKEQYVIIENSLGLQSAVGTYKVTEKSSMFHTVQMEINDESLNNFWNDVPISVLEALCTPQKKRVSLVGYIQNIGDTLTSPNNRKRKFIEISPCKEINAETEMIKLKLWGDEITGIEIPPEGTKVNIKGVIVKDWNKKRDLNSTCHTQIEECSEIDVFEGSVDGITWNSTVSSVLMNDTGLVCDTDVLKKSCNL